MRKIIFDNHFTDKKFKKIGLVCRFDDARYVVDVVSHLESARGGQRLYSPLLAAG